MIKKVCPQEGSGEHSRAAAAVRELAAVGSGARLLCSTILPPRSQDIYL